MQRVPNYTSVTLDSGDVLTASDWEQLQTVPAGAAGYLTGIVVFRANGTVSVAAGTSITVDGAGYRGGTAGTQSPAAAGINGESYDGINGAGGATLTNGTLGGGSGNDHNGTGNTHGTRGGGGGGGEDGDDVSESGGGGGGGADSTVNAGGNGGAGGDTDVWAGGGGQGQANGNGFNGGAASFDGTGNAGAKATFAEETGQGGGSTSTDPGSGGGGGGGLYGDKPLTTLFLGSGGGGGGGSNNAPGPSDPGSPGGGIIFIIASTVTNSGAITSNGQDGTVGGSEIAGGGGGAGGSILIQANSFTNSLTLQAKGGLKQNGATSGPGGGAGGGGGVGRIAVAADSRTLGTTTPTFVNEDVTPINGVGATWSADEDTPLTGLAKLATKRVRFEIANAAAASGSVLYRLEVSQKDPTSCAAAGSTWTRINSSTEWDMVASTHFTEGDPTSNVNPGLTDAYSTFVPGQLKDLDATVTAADDETTAIALSETEFTEIEYAIQATTSATGAAIYCFRLTNAGVATGFSYSETKYAKVTLGNTADLTGTLADGATLAEIVAGTETLIITLTGNTWHANVGSAGAETTALINGLDSAQGEPNGWNTEVQGGLNDTHVVQNSPTLVTITLPAFASYATTADETITLTVPAAALSGSSDIVATPTFTVTTLPDLQQVHYRWRKDDGGEGISSTFDVGTGVDGAVVISAEQNINTALGGTVTTVASFGSATGGTTLTVAPGTGSGYTNGDEIFLINMQGDTTNNSNTGNYEFLTIASVSTDTLTFTTAIQKLYGETASNLVLGNQKIVLQRVPQWTTVTINSGGKLIANAWDGSSGGVVVFRSSGAVTINGTGLIDVDGLGYRGGAGGVGNVNDGSDGGVNGESYDGSLAARGESRSY